MCRASRGAGTILCIGFILPLLMACASFIVEISQFYHMLNQMQKILDSEIKEAMRLQSLSVEVEESLRARLRMFEREIVLTRMSDSFVHSGRLMTIEGRYRGVLLDVLSTMWGVPDIDLPFKVSSRARRVRAATLVLFDRRIGSASAECEDEVLNNIEGFVESLDRELRETMGAQVVVGAYPQHDGGVEAVSTGDSFSRCNGRFGDRPASELFALQGVMASGVDESLVAQSAQEFFTDSFLSEAVGGSNELLSVVIVTPFRADQDQPAERIMNGIRQEAFRIQRRVRIVVIVANAPELQRRKEVLEDQVVQRLFVSGDDLESPTLRRATASLIAGRVVVAE